MSLTYHEERLYQAIAFMRNLRFDAPLPDAWVGGRSLYEWFRGAVAGIVVETCENSWCCQPPKVIHICRSAEAPVYDWRRTIDRMWLGVLVHEARHADTNRPHTCPTDQTKDARVADMGSFGVQYWLDLWIAEHSDQPDDIREWYRHSYRSIRLSAFCLECANSR